MTQKQNAGEFPPKDPMKRTLQQNRQRRALQRAQKAREELVSSLAEHLKCSPEYARMYAREHDMLP